MNSTFQSLMTNAVNTDYRSYWLATCNDRQLQLVRFSRTESLLLDTASLEDQNRDIKLQFTGCGAGLGDCCVSEQWQSG